MTTIHRYNTRTDQSISLPTLFSDMSNGHKKRKITGTGSKQKQTPYGQSRGRGKLDLNDNDVISSSDDDFFENDKYRSDSDADSSTDDDNNEKQTVEEVKLKLAKQYLAKVEADVAAGESVDEDEDDDDRVGYALQHQRRAKEGTLNITIADRINDSLVSIDPSDISITTLRGHDLTPTCVALHQSGVVAYSGSKDNSIIQWDIENECRIQMISQQWKKDPRYDRCGTGEVLSMDVSDDGRYLAVGGRDGLVRVFDVRVSKGTGNSNDNAVTEFSGHKGPVTAIAFRNQSLQMFSGSEDRCIRHYNLDELTYVETLYGHQSAVIGIDCFRKERPISIGRDRTMRAWKVSEDSHLIFRGGSLLPPADCLSVIKDDWFVTGHENGVLSLWSTDKKKPVKMIDSAHGMSNGITSCGALKNSDLLATGSKDGFLRLWKVS